MRPSLSLPLYLLLQPKAETPLLPPVTELVSPVVWAVAQDTASLRAVIAFAKRLRITEPDMIFLVTSPITPEGIEDLPDWIVIRPLPGERAVETRAFLADWQPAICLWVGSNLRPGLILAASKQNVPLVLVNTQTEPNQTKISPKLLRLNRRSLQAFNHILLANSEIANEVVSQGVQEERTETLGLFQEENLPLAVDPDELDKLAEQTISRQLWLAVNVSVEEVDIVLAAHRKLRRTNRRLMLVLDPEDKARALTLAQHLNSQGWRVVLRSSEKQIEENTQVLIADQQNELGLWYRLAPITFMGGTFEKDGNGLDPYHPATLGSAVLHGPRRAPYRSFYDALHRSSPPAARQLRSVDGLVEAVTSLLSPDEAAEMAHAAWDVASQGAAVADRMVELVSEALDKVGGADA